jgi:D-sedoheptulose 7-phosphate isomerase
VTKDPYFEYLANLLDISEETMSEFARQISDTLLKGKSVWLIGNGGSASTAEHFETDLSFVRLGSMIKKSKVCALSSNSSLISAIANDLGYEHIFSHQLMRRAEPEDLCIVISASGNSENLVHAVHVCNDIGVGVIGLLGFDGGKLIQLIDDVILINSEIGRYGPVEDAHLAICHSLSGRISKKIKSSLDLQG